MSSQGPTRRAAVYARHSTHRHPVAAQVKACRRRLAQLGHDGAGAELFSDGGPMTLEGPNDLAQLLRGALAGEVSCVAVTELSRISRDREEALAIVNQLAAYGVPVITCDDSAPLEN